MRRSGATEGFREMKLPPGLFATDSVRDHAQAVEQDGDSTTSFCFSAIQMSSAAPFRHIETLTERGR